MTKLTNCGLALVISGCLAGEEVELAPAGDEQVLGILAEPAEAAPGTPISVTLLVAGEDGLRSDVAVRWSLCRTPKALSESGFASRSCVAGEDPALPERGVVANVRVPADACARFGGADAADLRPRDADPSGGYYQPLRVALPETQVSLERLRLLCPLRDAPLAIAQDYAASYVANRNPAFDEAAEAVVSSVQPGAEIDLRVRAQISSFERYMVYEHGTNRLQTRTESLEVAWHVSRGEVLESQGAVAADGSAQTRFRAPAGGGDVLVWVILRDDRGGLNYRMQRLRIGP
ncbi:MAG: hypothetical protein QM778_24075 [Myxococcales bacterium]